MTRKTTLPGLLVVLGLSLAACAGGPAGGRPGVARIVLGPSGGSVPVGAAVSFRAVALDAEGAPVEGVTFDWRSGDPAVLSVDAQGRAVARATGTTTVSASAYGRTGQATLEVTPASGAPVAVDWTQTRPTRYPSVQDLEAAAGTLYLLTREGRLYLSTAGGVDARRSWRPAQAGNFEGCTELSAHPHAPGVLLAVCGSTELRRSSNGGRYWETVLTGAADLTAPVFHPHDSDVVHAGAYRSEDGGETWTRLDLQGVLHPGGRDPEVLYDIANRPGPVFGTTVRISRDGGESWQDLGYPLEPLHCETPVTWRRTVAAESGKLLLVAFQDCPEAPADRYWFGTYASTDGGSSWTLTGSASGTINKPPYAYPHWYFAPGSDTVLFATGDSIDNTSPLYRSRDGGATWQTFAAEPALSPTLHFVPARPGLLLATSLHDTAGHYGVYRWLEEEGTWRDTGAQVRAPLGLRLVHESGIYFFERGDATALEGLWFTADAFSSSTRDGINRGLDGGLSDGATAGVRAVDLGDGDRLLVGRLATRDAGESWQTHEGMPPGLGALAQAPSLPRRWYYASEGGHVHLSDDGGETLTWQSRIPNHGAGETPLDLAVSHADPDLLYALSPAGVHRSADAGVSWQWAASGVDYPGADLEIDPADDQTLYLATQGGVYLTHDGGRSWRPANQGLANLATTALALGADGATLYAGTSHGGAYRSLDAGGTWEAINTGLASSRVTDIATHPTDPDVVYLATLGGVYASTDKGSSWLLASRGLYSPQVDWLELSADGERLYLMTRDNGVYRGVPGEAGGAGFATQGLSPEEASP